jgi:hypothetical protein
MCSEGRFWSPAHDRSAWGYDPLYDEWMAWEHGLEPIDDGGSGPLLWRNRRWQPIPMDPEFVPAPYPWDDPEWVEWVEVED